MLPRPPTEFERLVPRYIDGDHCLRLTIVEEDPREFGYLRSRWSSELLALELARRSSVEVHATTVRRWLARLEFGYRRARPTLHRRDPRKAQRMKAIEAALADNDPFWFYRFAMDALLIVNDWARVETYAAALENYTRDEPLGWTDFYIARGRALAAFGRGKRDETTMKELQRLEDEAERVGLKVALPALEKARSST
jgi:hypothetical protein